MHAYIWSFNIYLGLHGSDLQEKEIKLICLRCVGNKWVKSF